MGIGLKSFYTPRNIFHPEEHREPALGLQPRHRMKDLEDEGVTGEIAFLQTPLYFFPAGFRGP